jgi:precorrin-8X/cobalt-precorrin-8 methylmutase
MCQIGHTTTAYGQVRFVGWMSCETGWVKGSKPSDRCFDRYVMIDWSANSVPKRGKDSIWVAIADRHGRIEMLSNPRTRHETASMVLEILRDSLDRTFVGCDFSFGYPSGLVPAIVGAPAATWRDLWLWVSDRIQDDERNRNNRFVVAAEMNDLCERSGNSRPLWGYPGSHAREGVSRYRPESYAPFDEFRLTEQRVRSDGHRPFSSWQLAYPGSVGSQMLMGMAWIEGLRASGELGERVRIWPFETGIGEGSLDAKPGEIVFAEVWPSMFDIDRGRHEILDAAQVMTVVEHVARADVDHSLRAWANPSLSDEERLVVLREEGWTLGVH